MELSLVLRQILNYLAEWLSETEVKERSKLFLFVSTLIDSG